jgi:transposase
MTRDREKVRAANKRYRDKNREAIAVRRKQRKAENPDAAVARRARYYAANRERILEKKRTENARTKVDRIYIDEVVVDRLVRGEACPATKHERYAAFQILESRGLLASEMAQRLGCSQRTIERYRSRRETP